MEKRERKTRSNMRWLGGGVKRRERASAFVRRRVRTGSDMARAQTMARCDSLKPCLRHNAVSRRRGRAIAV